MNCRRKTSFLINSTFFRSKCLCIPWIKNIQRINIGSSAVLSQIRFIHTSLQLDNNQTAWVNFIK